MNTFMKISSAILMILTAAFAVSDLLNMQWVWGLLMVFCFFLNLRTFKKCCEDSE